jgi:DNA-binding transcriptional ArsR family regulator
MAGKSKAHVDLLGDPWRELPDPRGRPSHKRCPKIAETVALLAAGGDKVDAIARRVGLSAPTVEKYYFPELDQGEAKIRQLLREKLWDQTKKGNMSAARLLQKELERGDAIRAGDAVRSRGQSHAEPKAKARPVPRIVPPGKKELQQAAAQSRVSGRFAPRQTPRKLN